MEKITGFTPGPYRADNLNIKAVSHGKWFTVARIAHRGFTDAGVTANARLIANAPAMHAEIERLEAANARLCEALEYAITYDGATAERSHTLACQLLFAISEEARAALAQARGQS